MTPFGTIRTGSERRDYSTKRNGVLIKLRMNCEEESSTGEQRSVDLTTREFCLYNEAGKR